MALGVALIAHNFGAFQHGQDFGGSSTPLTYLASLVLAGAFVLAVLSLPRRLRISGQEALANMQWPSFRTSTWSIGMLVAAGIGTVASCVAAFALPWAVLVEPVTNVKIDFGGGPWSIALVLFACLTFFTAAYGALLTSRTAAALQVCAAAGSLASAVLLALSQIANANSYVGTSSSTSFGVGSAVGILTTLLLVAMSVVSRRALVEAGSACESVPLTTV